MFGGLFFLSLILFGEENWYCINIVDEQVAIKIIYSRDLIRDFLNKIIVLINITL